MIAILYKLIDATIGLMAALNGFEVTPFALTPNTWNISG
jgi:hypothetical protein